MARRHRPRMTRLADLLDTLACALICAGAVALLVAVPVGGRDGSVIFFAGIVSISVGLARLLIPRSEKH